MSLVRKHRRPGLEDERPRLVVLHLVWTDVGARTVIDHESIKRFPLEWPVGWKRTPTFKRLDAPFGTKRTTNGRLTVMLATERLENEVERLGARNPVLSTNVSLRLDGRPRSDENPSDPGAAIYFSFKGKASVLACDRFRTVADNIAAIAGHIEALRRVERYGVGTIEQALAGYKALPADTAANWRAVFGFPADSTPTLDQVDSAYKAAAREKHPDLGGTDIEMSHVNRARDYALMELQP
jgi:hypothetical protein